MGRWVRSWRFCRTGRTLDKSLFCARSRDLSREDRRGDGRGAGARARRAGRSAAGRGRGLVTLRCAFYGRLSTDDKQDQTLARPSQLEACQRKATELGGEVVCEFFDQESGARDDRPGWTALTQE